jgi:hypothetical protein
MKNMRKTQADEINLICDCGYETGWFDALDVQIYEKVIRDGGKVNYYFVSENELTCESSECPNCKAYNSFDVDCKHIISKGKDRTFSAMIRI